MATNLTVRTTQYSFCNLIDFGVAIGAKQANHYNRHTDGQMHKD